MTTQIEFTDKEQIFYCKYSGNFDTPKKLNRSEVNVPETFINDIEGGAITSSSLKELNKLVPIFVYKTCLTIHGNLGEIGRTYLGGYKNIHQNKNGSLEVKYNAIDYQIKEQIARNSGMRHNRNSTQDYLSHTETFNDREAAIKYLNEQKNKFER